MPATTTTTTLRPFGKQWVPAGEALAIPFTRDRVGARSVVRHLAHGHAAGKRSPYRHETASVVTLYGEPLIARTKALTGAHLTYDDLVIWVAELNRECPDVHFVLRRMRRPAAA